MLVNGRRIQAQVAEQDEKVQAARLGRGENLTLDLVVACANRLGPRLIEKQLVIRTRQAAEFLLEDRESMAGNRDHRASKAH